MNSSNNIDRIGFIVSANHLTEHNAGIIKTTDPFAVIYMQDSNSGVCELLGVTEPIVNSLDPRWPHHFIAQFTFGISQEIVVKIYSKNGPITDDFDQHTLMGVSNFKMSDLLKSKGLCVGSNLSQGNSGGTAVIRAEPLANTGAMVQCDFSAEINKHQCIESSLQLYLLISRQYEDNTFGHVYKIKQLTKEKDSGFTPRWPTVTIPMVDLCNCDPYRPLVIEVLTSKKYGRSFGTVGVIHTTLRELLDSHGSPIGIIEPHKIPLNAAYKNSGVLSCACTLLPGENTSSESVGTDSAVSFVPHVLDAPSVAAPFVLPPVPVSNLIAGDDSDEDVPIPVPEDEDDTNDDDDILPPPPPQSRMARQLSQYHEDNYEEEADEVTAHDDDKQGKADVVTGVAKDALITSALIGGAVVGTAAGLVYGVVSNGAGVLRVGGDCVSDAVHDVVHVVHDVREVGKAAVTAGSALEHVGSATVTALSDAVEAIALGVAAATVIAGAVASGGGLALNRPANDEAGAADVSPGVKSRDCYSPRAQLEQDKNKTILLQTTAPPLPPSMSQYIMGGCEVSLAVAIDFTASNGHHSEADSLHHISTSNPGSLNMYQQAITTIGGIVEPYDSDKLFPVFGYGAQLARNTKAGTQHCFALTEDCVQMLGSAEESQPVVRVQGILNAYNKCLSEVIFKGPTNFAPIIERVSNIVAQAGCSQLCQKYTVLLMLTDGAISDTQQTVEAIIRASDLPLSIVIVGLGSDENNEFAKMSFLDSDDHLLRNAAGNKQAVRDIVQFVAYKDFVTAEGTDLSALSDEVLGEIPSQFLAYMVAHHIVPNEVTFSESDDDAVFRC